MSRSLNDGAASVAYSRWVEFYDHGSPKSWDQLSDLEKVSWRHYAKILGDYFDSTKEVNSNGR